MLIQACAAPLDAVEPAPLTEIAHQIGQGSFALTAYWCGETDYYVRADARDGAPQWFRIVAELEQVGTESVEELARIGTLMASVLPMSAGRVAFPTGSSGRVVYRIWRTRGTSGANVRTRILGVRAARSRRLPA